MDALGLIETKGLLPAIESTDAMLKAANVRLLDRVFTGGGLVTVMVQGDVGAVRASVDAGSAAVKKLGEALLVSEHVIPRPHNQMEDILYPEKLKNVPEKDIVVPESTDIYEESADRKESDAPEIDRQKENGLSREQLDKFFEENDLAETIKMIETQPVVKLRRLAREYKNFGIQGREISKAGKKQLLEEFQKLFRNCQVNKSVIPES